MSSRIAKVHADEHDEFEKWYYDTLELQGHACAICKRPFGDTRSDRPCVDHDRRHCTGARHCRFCRRGLLCSSCNLAIGLLQDSIEILQSAEYYLHNANTNLNGVAPTSSRRREKLPRTKLTEKQRQEMRTLRRSGVSIDDLAKQFKVSRVYARRISAG